MVENLANKYVNVRGSIHRLNGARSHITLSLYDGFTGLCRVSDGSPILADLYRSGEQASILTDDFDAEVTLTSVSTFKVTGIIRVHPVP